MGDWLAPCQGCIIRGMFECDTTQGCLNALNGQVGRVLLTICVLLPVSLNPQRYLSSIVTSKVPSTLYNLAAQENFLPG